MIIKLAVETRSLDTIYNQENPKMRTAGMMAGGTSFGLSAYNIYDLLKNKRVTQGTYARLLTGLALDTPFVAHRFFKKKQIRNRLREQE